MPLTKDDIEQYQIFIADQMKELGCFSIEPETIVWHHTTGRGLLGIAESGTIFATQAAGLNDRTEIRYAMKLYRDALTDLHQAHSKDAEASQFLTQLLDWSSDDPALPSHGPSRFFVACFSRLEDDLNQWRAYSEPGGENGYAIGFHARGLVDPNGAILKVNYATELHKKIAANVAEATLRFYREGLEKKRAETAEQWTKEFIPAWEEWIGRLAPVVKDGCFRAEEEFRLVHELDTYEVHRMRFQQKATLLARYMPLNFPVWMQLRSPMLPIAKILIGPGRQQHISRISVNSLLRQMGYGDIPVEISRRPLQRP
jgi:hypothetical protein